MSRAAPRCPVLCRESAQVGSFGYHSSNLAIHDLTMADHSQVMMYAQFLKYTRLACNTYDIIAVFITPFSKDRFRLCI
jgi:hypothetical protein